MHTHQVQKRVLVEVLLLNAAFFFVELIGGLAARSLALVADAGHMLSDAGALGLALLGAWFASRPPTPEKSFGFVRAEILTALVNGLVLLGIAGFVLVEAIRRIGESPEIRGGLMLTIAVAGLGVNVYSYLRLHRGGQGLNIRAVRLHMAADALASVGTITAGVLIITLGWVLADLVVGVAVALLIVVSVWGLIRESVNVLLEATPASISLVEVRQALSVHPGVQGVHDLHVWTLSSGYVALSAHVVVSDAEATQQLLVPLREMLKERFDIDHATLQMETPDTADEPIHCTGDPRCLP